MDKVLRVALIAGLSLLLWQVARTKQLEGRLLGLPYDLRPPSLDRLRQRAWNPDDPRLLTPHVFGWGYTVNLYQVGRRLGLIRG
jgi:hypothetical protein